MPLYARPGPALPYRYCTGTYIRPTITLFTQERRLTPSGIINSIHDSSASDENESLGTTDYGKYKWAGMWRSIILSSVGVTAYPYCLWLKSLGLSDLEQLLRDVAVNPKLRPKFFEGPMQEFEILSQTSKTRAGKPILEWQQIVEKVGEAITKFVKDASDEENKALQLTSLEGANLPTPLLAVWTSRLSTLTTLKVRDGSVLTEDVAISIRENCPGFKDLICFNLKGPGVDENMGAVFRAFKENSLENFAVLSSNDIGHEALDGLMQHSASLRTLTLSSLQNSTLPFLSLLNRCPYLESLEIESAIASAPSVWAPNDKDPLIEMSQWLKECKHLKRLTIKNLGGASQLLSDVLKSPSLRLKDLEVRLIDDDEAFYAALGCQTDLEALMFRSMAEVIDDNNARHDTFMESICACKKLKDFNVMLFEPLQLSLDDLLQIGQSLLNLESLGFDGEWLTDSIWTPLSCMKSLTNISINGRSFFTFKGIKSFIEAVKADGPRPNFRLYIMNQQNEARITPSQEASLQKIAASIPGGNFDLHYWRNLSEDDTSSELSD